MANKAKIIVGTFLIVFIFYFLDVFTIYDYKAFDFLYQQEKKASEDIVIVGIDDLTWGKMGKWPIDREQQAEVYEKIVEGNPAVLGVDILYDSYSDGVALNEEDKKLVEVLKRANTVSMFVQGNNDGWNKSMIVPFKELREICSMGYVNPEFGNNIFDSVIRNTKPWVKNVPSFAYEIYKKYVEVKGLDQKILEKYNQYTGPLYIDFASKPKGFKSIPYYSVYNGDVPSSFFEDKIVIVGPYSLGMMDDYYTPLDNANKMFGVEIHANIIQNYLNDSFKQYYNINKNGKFKMLIVVLLILMMVIISFVISKKFKPLMGALINLLIIVVYLFTAKFIVYDQMNYVISLIYPIISIAMVYVSVLAFNYLEQRKERERVLGVFEKYVAPQVVNKILEKGEDSLKLGGVRRFISVLFVDIRGFTPLSEACQPEEIVNILNEYLDLCANAVFNNWGTLDKFIGDATMAIYNAPLDLEDHALWAVKTAWEMKSGAVKLKKELKAKYGKEVDFGIGVNTGYAVVGNIGSKRRMDYTAIGDTVNTSARLESNAKPGQILISSNTYELVKDQIEAIHLGGIKVKGKTNEIQVYQVENIKE